MGDALEGFNPGHDLCRFLINVAVALVQRHTGCELENYDVLLDGSSEYRPRDPHASGLLVELDEAALQRKLAAADRYPELRGEANAALARFGSREFRTEHLRPVSDVRQGLEGMAQEPPDAWQDFGVDADEFRRELQALAPFDASEGFRAFYRLYAKQQDKPRYGDKTPIYCEHVAPIERVLPEAHFVHIIRDGRDASLSLRRTWFSPAQDMAALARYWRTMVRARGAGRRAAAYLEVAYEELVLNPRPVLEAICAFIDLRFDEAMLRHWERAPARLREHRPRLRADGTVLVTHEQRLMQQRFTMQPPDPERLFRWRTEMTAQEHEDFLGAAGDTLDELGYPV